ncbi:hypothetical protein KBD09_00300 [Candidatus Woesebacteria bacterium]|nr:hypothetical protein [Candidatus Woesebacteria bacterium]
MQRFLRWTVPIAIAIMFLGAFSRPANLAAANAVSGDHNVATINNVGSAADQLIALNTDSNLNPNQMVLLRSYGHDGQTQQAIAMDNGQTTAQQMASAGYTGIGIASAKGFNGHNWATTVWRNDERQQLIANYSTNTGSRHLAYGVATTFNPPGCQYMAATNETWTDGHLAWRDDANMGGAAMAATGHHRLRALRQYLLGYEIAMMWQPATRQQLQL